MLSFIIICAAIVGGLGFAIEYFVLNDLVNSGVVISKQDYYLKLLIVYVLLLIPPFIMMSPSRTEKAAIIGSVIGSTVLEVAKWISIGVLIAIGFNAFN